MIIWPISVAGCSVRAPPRLSSTAKAAKLRVKLRLTQRVSSQRLYLAPHVCSREVGYELASAFQYTADSSETSRCFAFELSASASGCGCDESLVCLHQHPQKPQRRPSFGILQPHIAFTASSGCSSTSFPALSTTGMMLHALYVTFRQCRQAPVAPCLSCVSAAPCVCDCDGALADDSASLGWRTSPTAKVTLAA